MLFPFLDAGLSAITDSQTLNQTPGWGCESGDSYGSGTSFDGDGIGTNQPDTVDYWKVYSAVGTHGATPQTHQALSVEPTQLGCSEGWTCESTDSAGNVYDGNSGWTVVDSYSCGSGECGGYGVDHSIVQTDGNMQLSEDGKVHLGDEIFDFSGDAGDVHVPVDQIESYMYANGDMQPPISPLLAQTGTSSLMTAPGTCSFIFDPTTASCSGFSEPLGTGGCSGISVGPAAAMQETCVGSTCIQAEPGSIELQYALAAPCGMTTVENKPPAFGDKNNTHVRPTPAHFLMTAHAVVFGCISATGKLWNGDGKGWSQDFKMDAKDAADTVTPIGGYVLRSAFDDK